MQWLNYSLWGPRNCEKYGAHDLQWGPIALSRRRSGLLKCFSGVLPIFAAAVFRCRSHHDDHDHYTMPESDLYLHLRLCGAEECLQSICGSTRTAFPRVSLYFNHCIYEIQIDKSMVRSTGQGFLCAHMHKMCATCIQGSTENGRPEIGRPRNRVFFRFDFPSSGLPFSYRGFFFRVGLPILGLPFPECGVHGRCAVVKSGIVYSYNADFRVSRSEMF